MTVHITNIANMGYDSVAQIAQNMVTEIATRQLDFDPFTIFEYDWGNEPVDVRNARFDGIIANFKFGDTLILQSPTWHSVEWENQFMDHFAPYPGIQKIVFIHDVIPLMFEANRYLMPKWIALYNKADLVIVPSKRMYDFLVDHGLKVKKYVVQHFWDHLDQVEMNIKPKYKPLINFAGDPRKFDFVKKWQHNDVKLSVYCQPDRMKSNEYVEVMGWKNGSELVNSLRSRGGFGLVWSEEPYWSKYMTMNTSFKLSSYLASGIPIIVNSETPEKETIARKHLGIIADSLDEAVEKIKSTTEDQYKQMTDSIDSFAKLIRGGYFTKRALIEAVFKSRYE